MAVQWSTFPIEFKGGLISNMSPLQQGLNAIGSATILQNMEPDRQGGYTKMRGYQKYTDREIPGTGKVVGLHVVSGGRAVVARKVDTDAVTELTTATSTVNGAVSSSTSVALDNNTATATINGAISNSTTLVLDRILSYSAVTGTASASGASASFDVTNTDGTYSATINAAGTGYVASETITLLGTSLGGATTANDATVTVSTVGDVTTTNPAQSSYSGSGTSATFNITRSGGSYSVAITSGGSGFAQDETITIVGTELDGATTANDATITITTVDGSGAITAATIAGTAVSTGPITAITIAGTGASFGTITKGMVITGADVSGTVTVRTVTDQNNIVLSTNQTLADNTVLSFTTNIQAGMFVTGTGISGDVTVASVSDQSNIVLSSAQTISDNTVLSFSDLSSSQDAKTAFYYSTGNEWIHIVTSSQTGGGKCYKAEFNFTGDDKVVFVDGVHYPMIYNTSGNTGEYLTVSSPKINTDVEGAELVTIFKNAAFYSKGSTIYFTAPFTVDNFASADGAGSISVGADVTGMIVFREQLIIFTKDSVKKLLGNTSSDFNLQPISDKIGCISPDSVQEFGGDVMYLAPDGLRLLAATDRIGDFALDVASNKIHKDSNDFLGSTTQFASVILREKGQYRIFAYLEAKDKSVAEGLVATKFIAQGADGIEWSTTKGMKVYIADSVYAGTSESIMFANEDGYLYEMEQTNGFGGDNIETIIETPYMPLTDPEIRKTAYKLTLYTDPTGQMDLKFRLLFDFDSGGDSRIVQPAEIEIGSTTGGGGVFLYGGVDSVYQDKTDAASTVKYGSKVKKVYNENLIGSFHTVAMRISSDSTDPPFTLDSAVLQYRQNDRQ